MGCDSENDLEGSHKCVGLVIAHVEPTEHQHSPADVQDDQNICTKCCTRGINNVSTQIVLELILYNCNCTSWLRGQIHNVILHILTLTTNISGLKFTKMANFVNYG